MAVDVCEVCEGEVEVGVAGLLICTECGKKHARPGKKQATRQKPRKRTARKPPDPKPKLIENYVELANNALEANNNQEAEVYANKIIELDPKYRWAWLIKGRAAGWQTTLQNLRIQESAAAFVKAVELTPEADRETIANIVEFHIGVIAEASVRFRAKSYRAYPDLAQSQQLSRDISVIVQSTRRVLDATGSSAERVFDKFATELNNIVVDVWGETILADYKAKTYPSEYEFDKFRNRVPPAIELLEMSIGLSSNDDSEDIVRYRNIIKLTEGLRDAKSYRRTVNGYVIESDLTQKAKTNNNELIARCRSQITRLERAERERKESAEREAAEERHRKYWANRSNKKRKTELETEQRNSRKLLAALKAGLSDLPGQDQLTAVEENLATLQQELSETGLFKRAERKSLQARIGEVESERDRLRTALEAKKSEVQGQIREVEKRLADNSKELTRPR